MGHHKRVKCVFCDKTLNPLGRCRLKVRVTKMLIKTIYFHNRCFKRRLKRDSKYLYERIYGAE